MRTKSWPWNRYNKFPLYFVKKGWATHYQKFTVFSHIIEKFLECGSLFRNRLENINLFPYSLNDPSEPPQFPFLQSKKIQNPNTFKFFWTCRKINCHSFLYYVNSLSCVGSYRPIRGELGSFLWFLIFTWDQVLNLNSFIGWTREKEKDGQI